MPTYVQVSQSEVQWQGDNEEPLQNLCTPKSTPVRIVKKLSLSPGIVTIKKKHSFDLLSLQRLEPTPPQKEILDDSFESYTSQDFELTDEVIISQQYSVNSKCQMTNTILSSSLGAAPND